MNTRNTVIRTAIISNRPKFNYQKANWADFTLCLEDKEIKINENEDIDNAAESLTNTVMRIAIKHIPNTNMPSHLKKRLQKNQHSITTRENSTI